MNILKLQNELKGVPDDALIGYVQNPTGNVPSYLALSELQRRKDMREKYQSQQAPQSSVAEDLQRPAAPQVQPQQAMPEPQAQGVAGLPVPDQMFSGQGMAAGGIVAFDDGGDVEMNLNKQRALNLDLIPSLNVETGKQNYTTPESFFYDFYTGNMPQFDLAGPPGKLYSYVAKGKLKDGSTIGQNLYDQMMQSRTKMAEGGEVKGFAGLDGSYVNPSLYGGEVKEYINPYKSPKLFGEDLYGEGLLGPNPDQDIIRAFENQRSMNPFISGMPRTDLADEYARLRLKASKNQATQQDYDRMNTINESMRPAENYPTGGGPDSPTSVAALKQSADKAAMDKQRDLAKEKEKAIRDIYAPKGGAGAREGVKSLSDYAKEFRDVVGEDPMQAKLAARMEKMDAASAKQAEQAPWMALAQAGFGIAAGKSPYALQNIAAGAMEGVKSYGDAQDKMAALEDKRFALMNDMAKAQRAEQLAIASKGVDSRDAQLARDQTERLADKKMANDMQIHLLDNAFDLQKAQLTTAAKDQPDATARATKIWPLVPEQPEYKEKMKALLETLGPEASTPGTRNHNKFREGRQAIQNEVYNNLIRKPGMGTTGATYNYVPGKGIMPL
jgi:hypothetical protein